MILIPLGTADAPDSIVLRPVESVDGMTAQSVTMPGDLLGRMCAEILTVEGIAGVAKLAAEVSPARVLFGSHSPLFYFESAALKIKEAGLPEDQSQGIQEGNARKLLRSVDRTG